MFIAGFCILFISFANWQNGSRHQQEAVVFLVPIVTIFFCLLPYSGLQQIKVIYVEEGYLIIKYPIKKKEIKITKRELFAVEIYDNIRLRRVPTHDEILFKLKDKTQQSISSLHTAGYGNLKKIIEVEFKEFINIKK